MGRGGEEIERREAERKSSLHRCFLFIGDKFYLFLLRFSNYVLLKVCQREAKPEGIVISLTRNELASLAHSF